MDPHPTQPGMPESEAAAEARRLIESWAAQPVRHHPTSFRDPSTPPAIGAAPPVPQPDKRIVPAWAAGIAVASIGVGAGSTGLGCAAWLLFNGLSLVSVPSLTRFAFIVIAPFAGVAMVVTAVAAAISKAKEADHTTTNVYEGTVVNNTEVRNNSTTTRGLFARTRNDFR
ncbi:hypothetical protein [Streptomyces longhuiensis]|uniref:hypothetical protein n=1 Tax=Streptomyces longhuiensis TaxID=2880933 RepID=UPI001D0AEA80|nr:hypothetical protein [Streptomyces longhuiensis]UDM05567.1 hypothetical protein LGI35_45825 [Streptomyces longhuiensis]